MSDKLKVLILGMHYAPEVTGNAPYTSSLASSLVARGHSVVVMAAHPHYPEWKVRDGYGSWKSEEEIDGVLVRRFRHYVPSRPTAVRRLLSELSYGFRVFTQRWGRPDVVISVSPALFATALVNWKARAICRNVKLVNWVQDLYSLGIVETGTSSASAGRIMARFEGLVFRRPSQVVVIHERFAAVLTGALGVADSRIAIVRNWTHVGSLQATDRSKARLSRGWGDETTVVLHAGNQGAKQGLENVVEAARLAQKRADPYLFVMLGHGNQGHVLRELARGVSTIEFIDTLPDEEFASILRSSDVLLVNELPGLTEMSVPSKLTTYFSTGLPVLAAVDPGSVTAKEIERSEAGITVDAGVPGSLLDGVNRLRSSPELCERLGANGLLFQRRELSQSTAIDSFEEVLRA